MQNKSEENWAVGNKCLADGKLNAAASRLYYSVFQSVCTWAKIKMHWSYRGSGAHGDMLGYMKRTNRHFAEAYEDLLDLRTKADYDPETPSSAEITALLSDAANIRTHYLEKAKN